MKLYITQGRKTEEFEYFIFDTPATLIDRYIKELPEKTYSLYDIPSFFAFDPPLDILKEDIKVSLLNIQEILKKTDYSDLIEVYDKRIKDVFSLTPNQVAIIWLLNKNKGKIPANLDNLVKLNRYDLNSERNINDVIKRETEWNSKEHSKLKNRIKLLDEFQEVFKGNQVPTNPLEIDEIIAEVSVLSENNESLLDIFDEFKPSKLIPFISLNFRGKSYYKVYKYLVPPDTWALSNGSPNGLFFKVLRVEEDSFDINDISQLKNIDNYYTSVEWLESNKIRFGFKIKGGIGQEQLQTIIFDSVSLKFTISNTVQHSIKGTFTVPNISLDKTILLDMIMNDNIFSFFFYVDEAEKSASKKESLYVKYLPKSSNDIDQAITLIFSNSSESKDVRSVAGSKNYLNVRVSKAKNQEQTNQFQNMFGYLLNYYNEKENTIKKYYKSLIPSFKISTRKEGKEKKEKKTGKRADALREFDEELFPKHYPRSVLKKEQPYIISADKVKDYVKKYGENKIMEYPINSGIFYACEPREPNEEQGYIYPGLRKNNRRDMPNRDKHPWLPACFLIDQKNKSYMKYLKGLQGEVVEHEKKDNILGPDKIVSDGRYGALPLQIANIFTSLSINPDKNILRYGVPLSPSSILFCLERAFDDNYDLLSDDAKQRKVKEIKKQLSKLNFSISKQETFNLTDKEIKDILTDVGTTEQYLDPSIFIRLLEELYKCNIILFIRDDENLQGNFAQLNHSQVELNVAPSSLPLVLIIKNQIVNNPYPYQCEIIYRKNKKVQNISERYKFDVNSEDDKKIVSEIERMYYEANDIYNLSNNLTFVPPFEEIKLFKDAESQYIDSAGKCRMLKYKDLCLLTQPLPPFNLPSQKTPKISNISYEKVSGFINKYKLKIKSQLKNNDKAIGLFVESLDISFKGFVPIEPVNLIPNIDVEKDELYPPLINKKHSLLDDMRDNRKIAHILQQYALYLYSLNDENLSKKDFKVNKNHQYDLNQLTKRFDLQNKNIIFTPKGRDSKELGKKLIVPTQETIEKLLFFVKQFTQNNPVIIKNYKDRKLLDGYYKTISDFKEDKNTIIFLNLNGLNKWALRGGNYINEIIISNSTRPFTDEPYLYRSNNIEKGRVMIIQNVYNSRKERALSVSLGWLRSKTNSGYMASALNIDDYSYKVYNYNGLVSSNKGKKINNQSLSIFEYAEDNYSAILFL